MRSHTLLRSLAFCLAAALATSASAAREAAITLAVHPSVTALYQPVTVSVTASARPAGRVMVQFKECGLYPAQFRDAVEARLPSQGGTWSDSVTALANGTFRAAMGPDVSNEVRVVVRAQVRLAPTRPGHYRAYVEGRQSFWRKRVRIERYDRRRSGWVTLRAVVLGRTEPWSIGTITYISSRSDEFALKLPKGTKLRAVFPLSQAKPCYAAGTSEVVQT